MPLWIRPGAQPGACRRWVRMVRRNIAFGERQQCRHRTWNLETPHCRFLGLRQSFALLGLFDLFDLAGGRVEAMRGSLGVIGGSQSLEFILKNAELIFNRTWIAKKTVNQTTLF